MKLFKLTTVYPAYQQQFYAKRPGLAQRPYAEQKAAFDADGFGWADFWSQALQPLGYEVIEVSANVMPMQQAWAREHGTEDLAMLEIVRRQAERFRPDVLFVDDYVTFKRAWLEELRQAVPSIRAVLGWCGAPFSDPTVFQAYDLVLSCIPELVEQFRALGHRAEHLNHAFEPRMRERLMPLPEPDVAVSFVGSIVRANQYHLARERMLESLVAELPLQIFTPSAAITWKEETRVMLYRALYEGLSLGRKLGVPPSVLEGLPVVGAAASWRHAPVRLVNPRLKPHLKPPAFGLEMYRTLARSRCTFNSHIDASSRSASNMRLFEATGAGTCLVTDWKENLHELFEPDREVVTYRSTEECIEKVRWLLSHPEECAAIAQRGQARTMREHTFAQRAQRLDQLIRGLLASSAREG